jgi:hypothetical protein
MKNLAAIKVSSPDKTCCHQGQLTIINQCCHQGKHYQSPLHVPFKGHIKTGVLVHTSPGLPFGFAVPLDGD